MSYKSKKPRKLPPSDRRCVHYHENGEQCRIHRLIGFDRCYFHEPTIAEDRISASKRGGINKGVLAHITPPPAMESLEDVRQFTVETLHQVRTGEMEPRQAAVISSLVAHILKTLPDLDASSQGAAEKLRDLLAEEIDVPESEEDGEAGKSLYGDGPKYGEDHQLPGV